MKYTDIKPSTSVDTAYYKKITRLGDTNVLVHSGYSSGFDFDHDVFKIPWALLRTCPLVGNVKGLVAAPTYCYKLTGVYLNTKCGACIIDMCADDPENNDSVDLKPLASVYMTPQKFKGAIEPLSVENSVLKFISDHVMVIDIDGELYDLCIKINNETKIDLGDYFNL